MDAKELFDQTSLDCGKLITQRYSTSFTLGIQTLDKKFHAPIYAIYGFVRYADEIVDTFHEFDKAKLLSDFRQETYRAIESGLSLNPVLHGFQLMVDKYDISLDLIESFFQSMAMDLDFSTYNDSRYQEYIYGSAEVVGLMCLKVFVEGDDATYQRLKRPAQMLGSAFQKVNFLRDIKSDFEELGRVYFPGVSFELFNKSAKMLIEADIQKDFDEALVGIGKLPNGAKLGVKVAYLYYQKLFDKIKGLSVAKITNERIRIPNSQKFVLLIGTYFGSKLGLS